MHNDAQLRRFTVLRCIITLAQYSAAMSFTIHSTGTTGSNGSGRVHSQALRLAQPAQLAPAGSFARRLNWHKRLQLGAFTIASSGTTGSNSSGWFRGSHAHWLLAKCLLETRCVCRTRLDVFGRHRGNFGRGMIFLTAGFGWNHSQASSL